MNMRRISGRLVDILFGIRKKAGMTPHTTHRPSNGLLDHQPIPLEMTYLVYSNSSSLSSSLYGLFGSLVAGGVGGILLTRSLEAFVNPGLKSSSADLGLVAFAGIEEADEGEVDSRSTRFFGRIPSLADV